MGENRRPRRTQPARARKPAVPQRVFGLPADQVRLLVLALIVSGWALRLAFSLAFVDFATLRPPDTGPDSAAYSVVSQAMHRLGVFAPGLQAVPFWPAGYPVFLAAVYSWFGTDPRGVVAVQQLVLSVSFYSAWRLASREFGAKVGLLTVVLLVVAPGLNLSATVVMYESLLAAATVVSVDLVSAVARTPRGRRRVVVAAVGMFVAGLGATLQPKLLVVAVLLLIWLVWRIRRLAVIAVCVAALSVGPAGLVIRNWVADDTPILSANLGFTLLMGNNDHARGGYVDDELVAQSCGRRFVDVAPSMDAVWRSCALDWARAHPIRAAALMPARAAHFWMPTAGSFARHGTWSHPLDPQRWLRALIGDRVALRVAGYVAGAIWMAATIGLVVRGARRGWRDHRSGTLLIVGPIIAFLGVTMVTVGDGRFRFGVTPFTAMLIAMAVCPFVERQVASRRR